MLTLARNLYHRIVPSRIRNPIGLFRRDLMDRIHRRFSRSALPPRDLLANIQMTPWAREYLGVGKTAAKAILRHLDLLSITPASPLTVLDFGCGSGRILRFFPRSSWQLYGCDIDRQAIEWSREALPFATLEVCSASPPLSFPDAFFDVAFSVSVFTHFSPEEQQSWARELGRVLRRGGILVLSTMGPSVLANFPAFVTPDSGDRLRAEGSLFFRETGPFNASAAFHTPKAIVGTFEPGFQLLRWSERGLDGFQDLAVLRRL